MVTHLGYDEKVEFDKQEVVKLDHQKAHFKSVQVLWQPLLVMLICKGAWLHQILVCVFLSQRCKQSLCKKHL